MPSSPRLTPTLGSVGWNYENADKQAVSLLLCSWHESCVCVGEMAGTTRARSTKRFERGIKMKSPGQMTKAMLARAVGASWVVFTLVLASHATLAAASSSPSGTCASAMEHGHNGEETVFVSKKNGTSYHRPGCRRLRFEKPLALGDASTRFSPCPVCRPSPAGEIVQTSTSTESESKSRSRSRTTVAVPSATWSTGLPRLEKKKSRGYFWTRAVAEIGGTIGVVYEMSHCLNFLGDDTCTGRPAVVGAVVGAVIGYSIDDRLKDARDEEALERGTYGTKAGFPQAGLPQSLTVVGISAPVEVTTSKSGGTHWFK